MKKKNLISSSIEQFHKTLAAAGLSSKVQLHIKLLKQNMKLLVIFVTAFSILQARSTKSKYKSSNRMKTSVHRGGNDFMPQHPLYVSHVGENNSKEGKAGFMGK